MPTGQPDFLQSPSSNLSSPSYDNAEDATRLLMGGGAQSRGGRWVWATGFESGLAEVIATTSGTGSEVTIETGANQVYQGAQSVKLKTGATASYFAGVSKTQFSQGQNFGFELICSFEQVALGAVEFHVSITGPHADSGQGAVGKIVIVINAQYSGGVYLDVNGTRTLLSAIDDYLEDNPDNWHYIKLIFNSKTNTLSRFYFDDKVFTLNTSGYQFARQTQVLLFRASLITMTNRAAVAYMDNVVITTDEP